MVSVAFVRKRQAMDNSFDDPERRRKAIRMTLYLTPVMFVFGYAMVFLTEFRPTHRTAMIVGTACAGLSLSIAAMVAAFGRDWMAAARVVAIGLAAVTVLLNACSGSG